MFALESNLTETWLATIARPKQTNKYFYIKIIKLKKKKCEFAGSTIATAAPQLIKSEWEILHSYACINWETLYIITPVMIFSTMALSPM